VKRQTDRQRFYLFSIFYNFFFFFLSVPFFPRFFFLLAGKPGGDSAGPETVSEPPGEVPLVPHPARALGLATDGLDRPVKATLLGSREAAGSAGAALNVIRVAPAATAHGVSLIVTLLQT
jgi:hypothetical protein